MCLLVALVLLLVGNPGAAVGPKGSYPADGSDEDNTYAKFSPQGALTLTIVNPELIGKIEPGQKFYLDFTKAE